MVQQEKGWLDAEAAIERQRLRVDGAEQACEAQGVEFSAASRVVDQMSRAAQGERALLRQLCLQASETMNELFSQGVVSFDDMVRQAYTVYGALSNLAPETVDAEREHTKELLPRLVPGAVYAVFDNSWITVGRIDENEQDTAPYLQTGGSVRVMLPGLASGDEGSTRGVLARLIELGPAGILERYEREQTDLINLANEEKWGELRMSPQLGVSIQCAAMGRSMNTQDVVPLNPDTQQLILDAQEPLLRYVDRMMSFVMSYPPSTHDRIEFGQALQEADHLNGEHVEGVLRQIAALFTDASYPEHQKESLFTQFSQLIRQVRFGDDPRDLTALEQIKRDHEVQAMALEYIIGRGKDKDDSA